MRTRATHWAVSWVAPPTPARLRGGLPLGDEDGAAPARRPQQAAQDRGGQVEGHIGDKDSVGRRSVTQEYRMAA